MLLSLMQVYLLPMLSVQDAVNENLITPIFIGDKKEILKCAEDLKWDISSYEDNS